MIITNYNNGQYIKLNSDYISSLFDVSPVYDSLELTSNVNCCGTDDTQAVSTADLLVAGKWTIDLDAATKLNSLLKTLNIYNVVTGTLADVLTSNVDLGYVEDNCAVDACTLEDFESHFIPIFKDFIDDYFASVGLTTNVTVSFDENTLQIEDLPENFIIDSAEYGSYIPLTKITAGYGNSYGKAFLSNGSLFVTPAFFNRTTFNDGIYKIVVKYKQANGTWLTETACAFIDITTKCKVAATLQNILDESNKMSPEKPSTIIHILHYALINGSNCNCNCNELCEIYTELWKLINNNPQIVNNNCGC